ncbi:MAG: type II toxin-antitoxin system YoeB family toxin [Bacteroidaceae bacterium]|nr:type II toxin-antitoxin system YoeB family toxin [Bacteroidaceae bacterium]
MVVKLLNEIAEHPKTGTGHPEPLKGTPEGRWLYSLSSTSQ